VVAAVPVPKEARPEGDRPFRRIKSLADGIFAFAITLLAIDIRVPELEASLVTTELPVALFDLMPRFVSFLITFWIVASYWIAYHRVMAYVIRYDSNLVRTTLLFLMFIVLLPFPADLIGRYPTQLLSCVTAAVIFAATGLALYLVWRHVAKDHRLVDPKLDPRYIRRLSLQYLSSPAVFLASIPLFYVTRGVLYIAGVGIFVGFVWLLIVPLHGLIDRWYKQQDR
jgi:uncharacterized membrane protein